VIPRSSNIVALPHCLIALQDWPRMELCELANARDAEVVRVLARESTLRELGISGNQTFFLLRPKDVEVELCPARHEYP
jgi:hypothetical protein